MTYRYFAIVDTREFPLTDPLCVIRENADGEERCTLDGWIPSRHLAATRIYPILHRAEPVPEEYVRRYQEQLALERQFGEMERAAWVCSCAGSCRCRVFQHFAIIDAENTPHDPLTVAREWAGPLGETYEETYTAARRWEPADRLLRIRTGRDFHEAVPVAPEYAEWFIGLRASRQSA
ncbi:hypothetical protein [Crossiella cryophila]|uniref:Uncharacterized protein n=1 Tax=Crossiella cryophila TaxID=43355 RepID=A0A7W7CD92_9PSEU|nr:hypothetical protein [Crossiella cryophila]MBB4677389.1 hypothetical protein [Crossiella cryophila]